MVVGYKMRWLTWMIARLLVKVPHIALVNLIADERAVPELIQKDWNPDTLASVTRELLSGPGLSRPETSARSGSRFARAAGRFPAGCGGHCRAHGSCARFVRLGDAVQSVISEVGWAKKQ